MLVLLRKLREEGEVARSTCCRCPLWRTRKTRILRKAFYLLSLSAAVENCVNKTMIFFCSPSCLLLYSNHPSYFSSKTFGYKRNNLSEWNLIRRLLCQSVPRRLLRLSQRGVRVSLLASRLDVPAILAATIELAEDEAIDPITEIYKDQVCLS